MDILYKYSFLVVAVILAFILVVLAIGYSLQKGKIYKVLLSGVLVNFFIALFWVIIYEKYVLSNDVLKFIFAGYFILLLITFTVAIGLSLAIANQKTNSYDQFISSLNNTSWNVYFVCDKNDRIKEISSSFLTELGLKEADVIGQKAFDVFDKTIRFTKVNDADITNKTLREYYAKFHKSSRPNEEYQREIFFQNCNGQTIVFNLIEKPIFVGNKYQGRLNIGQKKTDQVLASIERELVDRNKDLESIQYKFIAALELTEEGIFFNDLDSNYIWGNDVLVKDLALRDNNINASDYRQLIHPEDLSVYANTLNSLTIEHPHYTITYRLRVNGKYEFIKESGKRIFEDSYNNVILGFAKKMNTKFYEKTNVTEVDMVKTFDDLIADLDTLYKEHRLFQLVCVNLTSLPEINARSGRQVGNLIMGEYLKKLRNNFLTESSDIYRAGGLVFYFTITDSRKMEFFKRGLTSDPNAMNLNMNYGNIKAELKVNLGIAEATDDGINKEELIKNCNLAINTALNPNYKTNYAYYRDLKDIGIR